MINLVKASHDFLVSIDHESFFVPLLSVIPIVANIFLSIREQHFVKVTEDFKNDWNDSPPTQESPDFQTFTHIMETTNNFILITKRVLKYSKVQALWFPFVIVPALEKISLKWRMLNLGCLSFSAVLIEDHFSSFKRYI